MITLQRIFAAGSIFFLAFLLAGPTISLASSETLTRLSNTHVAILIVDPNGAGPGKEPVVLHLNVTEEGWEPQLKSLLRSHYGTSLPTYIEDFLTNIPSDTDPPFRIKAKVTETLLTISFKDPSPTKLCLPPGSTTPTPC